MAGVKEKTDITIDENVFSFIYGMAVNDAMNRGADIKPDDKGKLLDSESIKAIVKEYAEAIINDKEIKFEEAVEQIINANKGEDIVSCLYYGKIQKLINMTMKYLYIKYYDDPIVSKRFDKCYAPMDSIMLSFVFESYYIVKGEKRKKGSDRIFDKYISWSSSNSSVKETFHKYQEAIEYIIKELGLDINHIVFDVLYWEQAKSIIYEEKRVEEQRKRIREVWNLQN